MKRGLILLMVWGMSWVGMADGVAVGAPAVEIKKPAVVAPAATGEKIVNPVTDVAQQTPKTAPSGNTGIEEQWDFLLIGFWFDVPYSTSYTDVYGVKVGAPFCSGTGKVNGIETAVFCGASDNVNGLQACILVAKSEKIDGVQFSIVNFVREISGLQLGVVNIAKNKSFQLGIVNYIENAPIPFMPVCNFKF